MVADDQGFMRAALAEAERAVGRTSPNPPVGCIIVRRNIIFAKGFTKPPGGDHAEIDALKNCDARGATVYVTLEPCNHTGRTGPCSEALIAAGVARVVYGADDPNPIAKGGAARLREAGVSVEKLLSDACEDFLRPWLHFVKTGRPWVILKAAITLDGKLATRTGDSKWISNEESREEAHRMRDRADAILVGARTVLRDDPQLTTRIPGGRDALRVILDGKLSTPANARALPALIFTTVDGELPGETVKLGADRVPLEEMLRELGRRGVVQLLVEGGGEVHGQFLAGGLADEVRLFIAPKIAGADGVPLVAAPGPETMAQAWRLERVSTRTLGGDILVTGFVVK